MRARYEKSISACMLGLVAAMGIWSGAGVAAAGHIDTAHKHAWASQAGWLNFAPADGGGVTVHGAGGGRWYLAGMVWAENIGWIKLGSGTGPYANTDATNWGINVDVQGNLSGFAWSSQAGWLNVGAAGDHVAVNFANGQFSGAAWGETIGWVSFDGVRTTLFDGIPHATVFRFK